MRLRRVFYPLHIRLARHGCANRPSYQIVVIPSTKSRDEPPIEQLGKFHASECLVTISYVHARL